MVDDLKGSEHIRTDSLMCWHTSYMKWLSEDKAVDTAWYFDIKLDDGKAVTILFASSKTTAMDSLLPLLTATDNYPITDKGYYKMLNIYMGTEGRQFFMNLKWNDTDYNKPRHLVVSYPPPT